MSNPIVTITLENGQVMTGELYPEKAPNTVNNFIALANNGYYDGLTFHLVIPGFMIQGGCPLGTGTGGPGYSIRGEFSGNGFEKNDLKHTLGVLSMARSMHPDSAGSQFFIMVAAAPHLDGEYAAFGRITENAEAAIEVSRVPRNMMDDRPKKPQVIASVRVDTQGEEYPEPEKWGCRWWTRPRPPSGKRRFRWSQASASSLRDPPSEWRCRNPSRCR